MKKSKSHILILVGILYLFIAAFSIPAEAQVSSDENNWGFLIEPYLMFPNMSGETGFGNLPTIPVDAIPGDIFDKLHMGAMLYLEANTGKWAITSDFVYMNLQQDITPGKIINSGSVTLEQIIWELAGFYRILPFLEAGAGGRLSYLVTDIDAQRNMLPVGSEALTGNHSKTFSDPILITRLTTDINNEWLFQFRGDLGGFGIGSDFTWQLQAYAGYRFTTLFQLSVGYRMLGIDYDKGEDDEHFIFDMNEFGPVIRLGFNF